MGPLMSQLGELGEALIYSSAISDFLCLFT